MLSDIMTESRMNAAIMTIYPSAPRELRKLVSPLIEIVINYTTKAAIQANDEGSIHLVHKYWS